MRNILGLTIVAAIAATCAAQTVTFDLSANESAGTVSWTITAEVTGGSQGLALIGVDLVQDGGNPATFDIAYADAPPAAMTNFARPAGITNPAEKAGDTTGYLGSQRGTAGSLNLIQIGGAQNTFGQAMPGGTGVAENATVVPNVGIGGPQVIATGSFAAPATEGDYTLSLANGFANVITTLNSPPNYSPVAAATIAYANQSAVFTVGGGGLVGDLNCDGFVNFGDIDPFVLALTDPDGYAAAFPACDINNGDINGDTFVNFGDIDPFVDLLTGG